MQKKASNQLVTFPRYCQSMTGNPYIDDIWIARIAYVAILLFGYAIYSWVPEVEYWVDGNPWLSYPPIVAYIAIAGWMFPGLGDDDGPDYFLDD